MDANTRGDVAARRTAAHLLHAWLLTLTLTVRVSQSATPFSLGPLGFRQAVEFDQRMRY